MMDAAVARITMSPGLIYVEVKPNTKVCAYRFGASEIETGFENSFKSAGFDAWGGGAEVYVALWTKEGQCWLRPGTCNSTEACAVAMEDPHILIHQALKVA